MIVLHGLFIFAGIIATRLILKGDPFERVFWSLGLLVFILVGLFCC